METFLLSKTSLPNLHPALVHYPIVLLVVALLTDIAALTLWRDWLRKSAVLLYVLGAASAGFTFWSGRRAAETVELSAQVEQVLSRHENMALYTLWFFAIYAAIRLFLQLTVHKRWVFAVMILISFAGQVLLVQTADLGGRLVYKHAVAVVVPVIKKPAAPPPQPAQGPVIQESDIVWNFVPGSESRLSEFFDVSPGVLNSIQSKTERANSRTVLVLEKNEPQLVLLTFKSISYGDVQVEAEADLTDFRGTFSLVHHVSHSDRDFLEIRHDSTELGRQAGSNRISFGKEKLTVPSGFQTFKAVAAGTHFRGYLNGKLVVHGHGDAAHKGQAGLLLEGTGKLRIANIAVTSLKEQDHH